MTDVLEDTMNDPAEVNDGDQAMAQASFTIERPFEHRTEASRQITSVELAIIDTVPTFIERKKTYLMDVVWPDDICERAMFYDIRPWLEKVGAQKLVRLDTHTLGFSDEETSIEATASPMWNKVMEMTYKTKKGKTVSRGERLMRLLTDINTVASQIMSAQSHLRVLQQSSPSPHVDTAEMTMGSTHEMNVQRAHIDTLETQRTEKRQELAKQVAIINDNLPKQDSGWLVPMPEGIEEITQLNPVFEPEDE